MCVCVVCVRFCVPVCVIKTSVSMNVPMYVCIYLCMHLSMHVCIILYLFIYLSISLYIYAVFLRTTCVDVSAKYKTDSANGVFLGNVRVLYRGYFFFF